jgi:hypothetical protein
MNESKSARLLFDETAIWEPDYDPVSLERLVNGMAPEDERFVAGSYAIAKRLYGSMKPRKNGQSAFTHPTNVAMYLKLAMAQPHVIAAGLLHDVMEERVDFAKLDPGSAGRDLEGESRGVFVSDVLGISDDAGFPRDLAERVVEASWILTRHKSDLYYKSISGLFTHTDLSVRIVAALVKLADRMHNIQTIENYDDDEKLYQCFKNIFILNNAKQLVVEVLARGWDKRMVSTIQKLFKKSGKATFQALLRMAHGSDSDHRVFPAVTYLALALRKFMLEYQGLWRVTDGTLEPGDPISNLFHNIVKKYDHRLHHERAEFDAHTERELVFCRATFATLDLDESNLRRVIAHKDAMALVEVVASLLYREDYVIRGFECSRLCRRHRNCMHLERGAA